MTAEALLESLLGVVEELCLVRRTGGSAFGAGTVVGDDHDDGVVELALLAQEVEQPAQMMVGMAEEPSERLHQPRRQPTRVR